MATATKSKLKTRFLIISDTHGQVPRPGPSRSEDVAFVDPLPKVDVVLHAGDLTAHSRVHEFEATVEMLRRIDAPLKLFIGGNHDWILDDDYVARNFPAPGPGGPAPDSRTRDVLEAAARVKAMIREAEQDGVRYLVEGTHEFALANGARLKIFASPATPKYGGYWGFQYEAHDFAIPPGCDVAMTHGPPRGVLDLTHRGVEAGCDHLMNAVNAARPKMHCFGHIHEAWGARLVRWEELGPEEVAGPVRGRGIDDEASVTLDTLATVDPELVGKPIAGRLGFWKTDEGREREARWARLKRLCANKGRHVSLCQGGEHALDPGRQTLFVNAALVDRRYRPKQLPWIVDLELDTAEEGVQSDEVVQDVDEAVAEGENHAVELSV